MVAQYFLSSNTAKLVVLMPPTTTPSQKVLFNVFVCVCAHLYCECIHVLEGVGVGGRMVAQYPLF